MWNKVEACNPLNEESKERPWSKYSKESSAFQRNNPQSKLATNETTTAKAKKQQLKELKQKQKEQKLESLLGDLKDDQEFKEFLLANKAIKSNENIWKNDIHLGISHDNDNQNENADNDKKSEENKNVNKKTKSKETDDEHKESTEAGEELKKSVDEVEGDFENGRLFIRNLFYTCKEE